MDTLFGVIIAGCLLATVVGLIYPKAVAPWSDAPKRAYTASGYLVAMVVVTVIGTAIIEPADQGEENPVSTAAQSERQVETSNTEMEAGSAQEQASADEEGQDQLSAVSQTWEQLDKSDGTQAKRREFIQDLQDKGILSKIETPTKYPRVYVDHGWESLRYQDKDAFINVVLTYYFSENSESTTLILKDAYSGEKVGTYDIERGLELD